jgi:hypothetical protein
VSDREGDSSRRLSDALEAVLRSNRSSEPEAAPQLDQPPELDDASDDESDDASDDASSDAPIQPALIDDHYELPEIVPATLDIRADTDEPRRQVTSVHTAPATPATPPGATPGTTPATTPILPAAPPATAAGPVVEPQLLAGTTEVMPAHTAAPVAPATPMRPVAPPTPVTSWGDHLTVNPAAPSPSLREPGRRPRVRRVTRVVRHIDPWSTFKLALVFSLVGYLVVLTSGVLLWRVADSTGTIDNVERWFTQFGWETFELKGGEIFHNAWIIGLFCAVGLTGAAVLMATLFNLVSDIVGGVRVTVLEEEVIERTASSTRRYVVRRPPLAGATGQEAAWDVDDPEPPPAAASTTPTARSTPVAPPSDIPSADWSVDD